MTKAPPPPYPAHGKGTLWIQIAGKKHYVFGTNGYSDFKLSDWPPAAITKLAQWETAAKKAEPDKYSDFGVTKWCQPWLAGKHTAENASGITAVYAEVVGGTPSVGVLPGEGTVTNGISSVTDFLNKLLDPHLWVRIAEVLIGAVLVAVGAAHISTTASRALKSVPALGKVL